MLNRTSIFIVFLVFWLGSHGYKDKFVSITLDAKWSDTALHQEASEYLATQNQQYFWSLINDVSSFDSFTPDALGSVQNYHEQLIAFSSQYLNSMTKNLLRMALALRSYSRYRHDSAMFDIRRCSRRVHMSTR
mgnify:CR=1 FL=1